MKTIYLRFADREEALARLHAVLGHEAVPSQAQDASSGMLPTMGHWQNSRFDVDEVGRLHAPTGQMMLGEEGVQSEYEALPGWHINLLWWGEVAAAPDFGVDEIAPQTPSRIFAF